MSFYIRHMAKRVIKRKVSADQSSSSSKSAENLYVWEDDDIQEVSEPAAAYKQRQIYTTYGSLNSMVQHYQLFGFSKQTIADWLHVSSRQLERYIKSQQEVQAKNSVVERMALIDRLMRKGISTFGSEDHFIQWLKIPNYMLEGEQPLNLLDSYFGIEDVMYLLNKMEHTLPA